jgi:hypothetical protein
MLALRKEKFVIMKHSRCEFDEIEV